MHAPNVQLNVPVDAAELHRLASFDINAKFHAVDAFTSIPGPLCSSTRAEIIAVVLALCLPLKLDIATDSANVVRLLSCIIADPLYKPPKPWGLMANGDLWELVHLFVLHAGELKKLPPRVELQVGPTL